MYRAGASAAGQAIDSCSDEPTNAMDIQGEDNFTRLIREQTQGLTLVLITHRTSLLPLVDRLIIIDTAVAS